MKDKLNIRKTNVVISTLGLAILLLLSPCKVRKFIQLELGTLQTEVLNKSKTTIGNSNCNTFEVTDSVLTVSRLSLQFLPACALNLVHYFSVIEHRRQPFDSYKTKNHSISFVPYYILYRNFKVYL